MLDKAELDFGIYRIMNQKRKDIEQFLEVDLVPQVQKVLSESLSVDKKALQKELDDFVRTIEAPGYDVNAHPKVQDLKKRLGEAADMVGIENEVFSLLANFFKRYFDNGDFISMRRYKKDVYAIPYEGEEVKLHWANADQYYIKTSEYFKVYRFKIANGKTVCFELIEASTEQNNNKTQGDRERRFALANEELRMKNDELVIPFTYEPTDKKVKQSDLLAEANEKIVPQITRQFPEFADLLSLRPTEKDKQRTLLQKHLNDYTARNTFDYFIHKDLGGFLSRELDFYIKNEVLFIDDLNTRDEQEFLKQLSKIKAIKKIGEKIITFLAQLENFQKKLWLKKKMVVECHYCITLDRVPKELYPEIIKNAEIRMKNYNGKSKNGEGWSQIDEWIELFAIDEIKGDDEEVRSKNEELRSKNEELGQATLGFAVEAKSANRGFSLPLTSEFLEQNQFLVLDTAFFSESLKWQLISSIENFDEQCDGLLINSENFQALNLLFNRIQESLDCVYIDPPYNAKSSEILYKNTFKHASWISLIENRISLSKSLLKEKFVHITAIDEVENFNLGKLFEIVFPECEDACISIVHNPTGQQGNNFSFTHEFAHFIYPTNGNYIGLENREDKTRESEPDIRPLRNVSSGKDHLRESAANCFFPIYVKDGKIIGFGDVSDDDFHPSSINIKREDGVIEVYPIDPSNIESKWVFARNTVESIIDDLTAEYDKKKGIWDIIRKKSKFRYKSLWSDKRYSANSWGSVILNNMLPKNPFTYPKSIYTVMDCIDAGLENRNYGLLLDYFAGSATTGHAVINLNRADNGKRKFILVEMGEYFDTVTKPRIQKVVYSKDWKDGKPVSREGISHCFKYMRLESYEDTLNNLALKQTETQQQALALNPTFKEGYMLNYMLDVEAKDSLLNLEWFVNPFNCYLNITKNNELQPTKVDLIETFNYLIGLVVESYATPKDGYVVVTGKNLAGESILVVWRDCIQHNSTALNQFLEKSTYNPLDAEFDRIYVNGDNNVENLKTGDERWKVVLIEEEFGKRMFEMN
ncbi:MAG: DNA methyltransferase [Candidatus Kapaibacterium sp.]